MVKKFRMFKKVDKNGRVMLALLAAVSLLFIILCLAPRGNGVQATPAVLINKADKHVKYIYTDSSPKETEATAATEEAPQKRYELTEAERWEVASVVTAEAGGEPFEGKIAVAQCILQACEDERLRPSEIFIEYQYSGARPDPTDEALEAVQAVFDDGQVVTAEPIKYFYAPARCESEWHESQVHVITIEGHKFFKEATANG